MKAYFLLTATLVCTLQLSLGSSETASDGNLEQTNLSRGKRGSYNMMRLGRGLRMLRLGKRSGGPVMPAEDVSPPQEEFELKDQPDLSFDERFVLGLYPEDDGDIYETEGHDLDKRPVSMLRLGKRPVSMLRLGKRPVSMLRLGKRPVSMLRLGKRPVSMLRLGKRAISMLRLGKRDELRMLGQRSAE